MAASRGAVSEAIAETLAAAEIARTNEQLAAEVMCLQTAAQFGEASVAARLHQLAELVEGPRAPLAFRLAAAIEADDALELASVASDFEQMGDKVAALDAASYAAMAYRRHGSDESASECARRARVLAENSNASTPAFAAVRKG